MGPNRSSSPRRRLLLTAVLAPLLLVLLADPAMADFLTPEDGGSANADSIDTLYKFVLVVAAIVFFGVEGALLYCCFKYKARKGAVANQTRGNTRLEIGWTVGAAVILVVLAVFTFIKLPGIRNPDNTGPQGLQTAAASGVLDGVQVASGPSERLPPNGKSLDIKVNGQQYLWRYTYPDGDDDQLNNPYAYYEMVVPVETAVTLDIEAQDVNHSWWIPELGGKFDAVPGYTNHTWFKIPAKHEGRTFRGQCAELCGRNHANMIATVKAVSAADFEKFLADRKQQIATAEQQAAEQRQQSSDTTEQQP